MSYRETSRSLPPYIRPILGTKRPKIPYFRKKHTILPDRLYKGESLSCHSI